MPSCRGITLSITSAGDSKVYPEFPHPETSQLQNNGSSTLPGNNSKATSSLPTKKGPGKKAPDSSNPHVSVYIPSLPGKHNVLLSKANGPNNLTRNPIRCAVCYRPTTYRWHKCLSQTLYERSPCHFMGDRSKNHAGGEGYAGPFRSQQEVEVKGIHT